MSRKQTDTSRVVRPQETDDFKLINGIGLIVEKRLNGVGIFTFLQLASLSPADSAATVSGITGLTAERIIKQDWIGQAQKLVAQSKISASERPEHARHAKTNVQAIKQKATVEIIEETWYLAPVTNGSQEHPKTEGRHASHILNEITKSRVRQ